VLDARPPQSHGSLRARLILTGVNEIAEHSFPPARVPTHDWTILIRLVFLIGFSVRKGPRRTVVTE
jgi:hypothetical protein